jgi:hypothetical protein
LGSVVAGGSGDASSAGADGFLVCFLLVLAAVSLKPLFVAKEKSVTGCIVSWWKDFVFRFCVSSLFPFFFVARSFSCVGVCLCVCVCVKGVCVFYPFMSCVCVREEKNILVGVFGGDGDGDGDGGWLEEIVSLIVSLVFSRIKKI